MLGFKSRARGDVQARRYVLLIGDGHFICHKRRWLTTTIIITGNSFTPWFKLIAESFLYKWWDALIARSTSEENAATTAGVKADASVLRELVTDKDRNEIHR